ncbi:MAG: succinyl-diaminopimelate desuccinylase [Nitriliruptoraceae bacterium]
MTATASGGRGEAPPDGVRDDLVARLLEHLAPVCVTGGEGPIADAVQARYHHLGEPVARVGHSLVVGTPPEADGEAAGRPLVLLVGHLDVVPPTDADREPHLTEIAGGEVVVGRGASDMKGGNVVAMRLFEDLGLRERSPYHLVLVLYAGEEGPAEGNELEEVLTRIPWLTEAALAIVLEPTDGRVELGCLGGLHAQVTFVGAQAHSARPWQGRNALTMAGAFLAELEADHVREVEVDGLAYRDVWSATQGWTSGLGPEPDPAAARARNVIPDRFTINLNLRFAPSRTLEQAEDELRARVGSRAEVTVIDRSPPAPPHRVTPIVDAFVTRVGAPVGGKQAWTDVARFACYGVPAVNYGPGLTAQAHQRAEHVPVAALVAADRRLRRFLDPHH